MEQLNIVIKNGKLTKQTGSDEYTLHSLAAVKKAIKGVSTKDLSAMYKQLTGKEVKRFASKDDAAARIYKFINPTGKQQPKKKAAPKVSRTETVNKMLKPKAELRTHVSTRTIHVLDHEKKTFQKGSVRETCYNIVMENVERKQLPVSVYLEIAGKKLIEASTAMACLKKLCQAGQKVQTMELV